MSLTTSGSITIQNANPTTGTATTGSVVNFSDLSTLSYNQDVDTVTIQVTGTYTGVLTPQVSINGTTWVAVEPQAVFNVGTGAFSQTIASGAVGVFSLSVAGFRFFRLSANAAVTGAAVVTMHGTTAASDRTITNLGTKLDQVNDAVTNYPVGSSSTYIATATTTVVKSGSGHLARIVVGETAAGASTLYDNTAGSGTIVGVLKASIVEGTYEFNVAFATGLTVVTAGASKITVVWR